MSMDSAGLLVSGVRQLQIKFELTQLDELLQFVELLQKWNKAYNLTAIESTEEVISKHILDSLSVAPYLQGRHIIDVGSGAGLPGIPLATMCRDKEFLLIDANEKKTQFIQQAIIEIGLNNVQVLHQRVERYAPAYEFDTVVSRAYAPSSKLFESTEHLTSQGQFILMLGRQNALQDLPDNLTLVGVYAMQVPHLQACRHIAVVKKKISDD